MYLYFKYFKGIDLTIIYADDVCINYEIDWLLVGYTESSFIQVQVK